MINDNSVYTERTTYKKNTKLAYNAFNTVDKEYTAARDKHIKRASDIADSVVGQMPASTTGQSAKSVKLMREEWGTKWNKIFFETMNILAKEE